MAMINEIQEKKKTGKNSSLADYGKLAALFEYPADDTYWDTIKGVYTYLLSQNSEAALALQRFYEFVIASSVVEVQELFLRSFDIQAITTLDIGFVLFGEDYKRGKLLVHLNEEHKRAGNDCAHELSDHLPNLLRLLPKVQDETMQTDMATLLLLPAVEKMINEFSTDKIEKKDVVYKKHQKVLLTFSPNHRTVFQHCLQALQLVLLADFGKAWELQQQETQSFSDPNNPASQVEAEKDKKDFGQQIETEMLTEK